ncbi:class I SAM-dependent methyltransferase [Emcibacter nanhaiensis]|uniref:Class I SAM-dependent methyltransferase n=1 Tax=Emcibacter nanhaiensis TaxID=1505037 RepID=A0A501PH76_9PROT|nr:class I SAM-dependent methyltransferase [Emcibacter nanhaiensis]TPD59428.1 class I SAM-dependent methyltransferase [Emcibacter nanhaiensis]
MNELKQHLINLIDLQGPIPLSLYMAEALGNPEHGYYMKQDPFGMKGDFTTAPEISQMFGEVVGLWFANNWLNMGSPPKIHLVEVGPGRGTLMVDMLRAMKIVPGLLDSLSLHLVEMSPALRKIQGEKISPYLSPTWHDRLGDVLQEATDAPLFLIGNEFFDALPIRQFQKGPKGWHERLVGLDANREQLQFVLSPEPVITPDLIPDALIRAEEGAIAEVCSAAENLARDVAGHLKDYGGAALFIDYGHDRHGTGDTFQALEQHEYVDVFKNPGNADLTAHVNFQRLKECAEAAGGRVLGPVPQGDFLTAVGIEQRASSLLVTATEQQKTDIMSALKRLVSPDEMGTLFKVMAIIDPGLPEPAGF